MGNFATPSLAMQRPFGFYEHLSTVIDKQQLVEQTDGLYIYTVYSS